ncbi:Aste57867_22419 [Aphanomyces stellatus]|uniref:Aste57867_22419 protein n=1 Tax=Aphanomyces stellatus TaxID=120398 RepID=A0A485LLW9_9STRA|nr:hypothetical protein As57867_022349 [Aphanomyces stellatus]VFT99081.1 Aste57867_22419 [Aphanomyces stellatus]
MVELIEVIVKGICLVYCLAIYGVTQALKGQEIDRFYLWMTYILAMTCPCIWALIRCAREWDARRKVVVVKEKKKKKPDIATKKDPRVGLTQAEILAAQRDKAKEIGGIVDSKKKRDKKASPKRKGPPPKADKGDKKGDKKADKGDKKAGKKDKTNNV